VVLTGCAGRNEFVHSANFRGDIAGFWIGLWHGFTAPISLFGSILLDINIDEVYNKGFLYNTGFLHGVALLTVSVRRARTWIAVLRRLTVSRRVEPAPAVSDAVEPIATTGSS